MSNHRAHYIALDPGMGEREKRRKPTGGSINYIQLLTVQPGTIGNPRLA